jgi:basic membrane protein A
MQAALQLSRPEADVIYQVAAAGRHRRVRRPERGLYAIGSIPTRNDLEPGHVIASAVKNVGTSFEEVFKTIKNGSYKGRSSSSSGFRVRPASTSCSTPSSRCSRRSLVDKVKAARQQIIDGKLKVSDLQQRKRLASSEPF